MLNTIGLIFAAGMISLSTISAQVAPAAEIPWDMAALRKAPTTSPAPEVTEEGLTSIYLEGPAFKGKPTKVFALYGLPEKTHGKKVPGIVLVHGAGGTSFAYWVRLWNSRGYAAIAIDHGGNLPIGSMGAWQRNPEGGPPLGDPDIGQPREDQWMYHAVADSILAVSFLKSLPEVDGDRVGLTGISWGGVVASAVAGVDDRLKFVVPVYGCGYISYDFPDGSFMLQGTEPQALARWKATWDPANYLPNAKMPILWLTGTNDRFFTMRSIRVSAEAAKGPQSFCIRLRMPHGHNGLGENPEEIHAFAESIVGKEKPMATITKQGHDARQAWVTYDARVRLETAELLYTRDKGNWQDRNWETAPAKIETSAKRVITDLPAGTTNYYFNLIDERGLIVSSEYVAVKDSPASAQ